MKTLRNIVLVTLYIEKCISPCLKSWITSSVWHCDYESAFPLEANLCTALGYLVGGNIACVAMIV